MALLINHLLKFHNWDISGIRLSFHYAQRLHTSSNSTARSEYDKIKLKPFVEAPYDGSTPKWRRKKRLPHHVENYSWREEQGLPLDLNSCGPLTDKPDYSYVEENVQRPSIYCAGQRKRLRRHQENTKNIIEMIREVDFGKERYQKILEAKEKEKQAIIQSKLQPKGNETM